MFLKPPVLAVVLKVHMHCEACAQGIRKRILKMNGRCSIIISLFGCLQLLEY